MHLSARCSATSAARLSVPTTRIGLRLGLFDALHRQGPATAAELAARTSGGLAERYVREWALAQAANGYITLMRATNRFSLSPEQAMVFAVQDSPVYLAGAFDLAAAMIEGEAKVEEAFRDGSGVRWGDSAGCLFCSVGAFFRPRLCQLHRAKLDTRARRRRGQAEKGHQESPISVAASASPRCSWLKPTRTAHFVGFDFHEPSIEEARRHAKTHSPWDHVRFEARRPRSIREHDFDLITMYDCLHDMGDPRGCAAHMRSLLQADGTWMIVEPIADDRPEENLNPVGRLYYNASTMICVPTSLDQEVGEGLGAQAGEAKITEVVAGSGFTRVRRATEGPFNMVIEARP